MKLKLYPLMFISLLGAFFNCSAQPPQRTLDSIYASLNDLPDDTLKVDQYIKSAQWIISHLRKTDADTVLLQKALLLANRLSYKRGLAEIYNLQGVTRREHSDYVAAVDMHEKALKIADTLKDTVLMAYSLNNIGVAYRRLDENQKAFDYHFQALRLAEKCGNIRNMTVAINSIGNIQLALRNYKAAIVEFNHSLPLEQQVHNDLGIAINLGNLGIAYEGLGQLDKAIEYYQKSLATNQKINSHTGMVICYNLLGSVYSKKKDYKRSLLYLRRALTLHDEVNDQIDIADNYVSIGLIYQKMERMDSAVIYLQKGSDIAKNIRSKSIALKALKSLSEIYSFQKNYRKAFEASRQAMEYQDSLMIDQISPQLTKMHALLELNQKDNQISLLKQSNQIKELESNRKGYIVLLVTALLGLTLLAGFFYIRHRDIKSRRNTLDYQLRSLRSQMNPHFIFNSLNSIHRYIWSNQQEEASEYLTKFSRLMRIILENSRSTSVILSKEIQSLSLYLELEALRCDNKFSYSIYLDPAISPEEVLLPSMIIQPFVENAIWHGLVHKQEKGQLSIRLSLEDQLLRCEVEDNGIGRKKAMEIKAKKTETHESIGMQVTEDRIHLLRELSGNGKANVNIRDMEDQDGEPAGTRIIIHLPVEFLF